MGLEVLGDTTEIMKRLVTMMTAPNELQRRSHARKKIALYRNDFYWVLDQHVALLFNEPAIRQRLSQLIPFVGGASLLKRISDEVARPLYATAPMRRVVIPGDEQEYGTDEVGNIKSETPQISDAQLAFNAIAKEMQLDSKMDLLARLLVSCNDMFAFCRYVEKPVGKDGVVKQGSMVLDILSPDMVTVVADPDQPTKAMAIGYDIAVDTTGKPTRIALWDDVNQYLVDVSTGTIYATKPHDFGVIPIIDIHRRARWGCYWDDTTGNDLVAGDCASMLLDLISMKKVKAQSHIQLTYIGDLEGLVKDQVSDEESILVATGGKGGTFGNINLESDPSKIIALKESIQTSVAASYGISRDRLNQTTQTGSDDYALQERVSEMAKVLVTAELMVFEIVKTISREHPEYKGKIPPDAELFVDLGQIHNRVDRATQLGVRQTERSMGVRSGVDDVLEDNPEFGGDRKRAMAYIREKMTEEAVIIEERRKLNAPADANMVDPGQSPQANGAMGPLVRDAGSMPGTPEGAPSVGDVLAVKAMKKSLQTG